MDSKQKVTFVGVVRKFGKGAHIIFYKQYIGRSVIVVPMEGEDGK